MADFKYVPLSLATKDYLAKTRERATDPRLQGLPLPTPTLTRALGTLRIGEVTVLAGRESHGKSALAQQIAFNLAAQFAGDAPKKRTVFYGSLEMEVGLLVERAIAQKQGTANPNIAEYQQATEGHEIILCDSATLSIADIRGAVRDINQEFQVKLVVVDYLQMLADISPSGNIVALIDNAVRDLKDLARIYELHVLVLSSLNRSGGSGVPNNTNLRDSQGIAYAADNVLMIHQPARETMGLDKSWDNHAIFNVTKQRSGPSGSYRLRWDPATLKFEDAEETLAQRHLQAVYQPPQRWGNS